MGNQSPYQEPRQSIFASTLLGPLELVAAPSGAVLTTAEAKAHLRVTFSEDDTLIDSIVQEATRLCEEEISGCRQFLTATYDLPVAQWWWAHPLQIPRPPLGAVSWVKYYDTAGVQQVLDTALYTVAKPWKLPGRIERAPLAVFPAHQCDRPYPITVRFEAGYGIASQVPDLAKAAIKLILFDKYTIRGATAPAWAAGVDSSYGVGSLLQALGTGSYG